MNEFLDKNNIKYIKDADLSKFTTYKVGGKAEFLVYPKDEKTLINIIKEIRKLNMKFDILAAGSNVLFSDDDYNGVLINLRYFNKLEIEGPFVKVGSGYPLISLSKKCADYSLRGFEWASGIPGTVGGAVYMNAGAYNSSISDVLKRVRVLTPDLRVINLVNKELNFSYRNSFIKEYKGYIVLEATFFLKSGTKEAILSVMADRNERRKASQPWDKPSAGSVFRNPEGDSAGRLIDSLGLKGKTIGGAEISSKHANFIINNGNARASDIKKLINYVKDRVYREYQIKLVCEQEFKNWEEEK